MKCSFANDIPETPADTNPRNRIESVREEYTTLQNILSPLTSKQAELHLELQSAREDLAKHKKYSSYVCIGISSDGYKPHYRKCNRNAWP